jgi:tRNA(His) 5'-end guanylyltransferase
MEDPMGERMKFLEGMESGRRFLPMLPVVARLDGKCFSSYTNDLARSPEQPYDDTFHSIMVSVTKYLVEETCACMGYTQSDEITVGWYSEGYESQIWFDGRIQKMCSVLSAMASSAFNVLAAGKTQGGEMVHGRLLARKATIPFFGVELHRPLALFDCRIWQLPTLEEGANAFLWREFDATKNSVSMAARTMYSHKELMNKSSSEMQELMFRKGFNWDKYPSFFKRGTYIQKRKRLREMTQDELAKIPEQYRPTGPIERTDIVELELPPLNRVTNRPGVIFRGEDPVLASEKEGGARTVCS